MCCLNYLLTKKKTFSHFGIVRIGHRNIIEYAFFSMRDFHNNTAVRYQNRKNSMISNEEITLLIQWDKTGDDDVGDGGGENNTANVVFNGRNISI